MPYPNGKQIENLLKIIKLVSLCSMALRLSIEINRTYLVKITKFTLLTMKLNVSRIMLVKLQD